MVSKTLHQVYALGRGNKPRILIARSEGGIIAQAGCLNPASEVLDMGVLLSPPTRYFGLNTPDSSRLVPRLVTLAPTPVIRPISARVARTFK
jgi:hypothetical protein